MRNIFSRGLGVVLGLLLFIPTGLISGCSDTSTVNPVNTNSTVSVQGVVPAGSPGSTAVTAQAPHGLIEIALRLISQPAHAVSNVATLSDLAGFQVTAFNQAGVPLNTVTADGSGIATFSGLPAGIYRFAYSNPNFPTTYVQILLNVPANQTLNVTANPATTAVALLALKVAGGLDLSRLDVNALIQLNQSASFQTLLTTLTNRLQAGQTTANVDVIIYNSNNTMVNDNSFETTFDGQLNQVIADDNLTSLLTGGTTGGTSTGGTSTGGTSTGGTSTGGTGGTSTGGTGGTSTGGTSH